MRIVGIVLLLLLALQGCGRKGSLFLPAYPVAPAAPEQSEQKKQL